MNKKIVCVLLATLFAFTAAGCSGGDVSVSFDESMPWADAAYEYTEYKIERQYVGGNQDVTVAEGTYTSELKRGAEQTTLTNRFKLTYLDEEHAAYINERGEKLLNAGLTDTYEGTVTFLNDSLAPVSASKTQNVAQRPLTDNMPADAQTEGLPDGVLSRYLLPTAVKYADPRGYAYQADYTADTVHFTTTSGVTTEDKENNRYCRDYYAVEKDYAIKGNTRYDNEQLAYVVRAMTGCKRKGSGTFYLSNFYDSFVNDKYIRYTMNLDCADKNASTTLELSPEKVYLEDAEGRVEAEGGKYTIPCVQATVSISSATPGPAVSLLVTDPIYTLAQSQTPTIKTSKVVVQMTFTEYAYSSAKVNYRTVYTLTEFRNRPLGN